MDKEDLTQTLMRVAVGAHQRAIDACLEIVRKAKVDFNSSMEAVIVLRDVEKHIEMVRRTLP